MMRTGELAKAMVAQLALMGKTRRTALQINQRHLPKTGQAARNLDLDRVLGIKGAFEELSVQVCSGGRQLSYPSNYIARMQSLMQSLPI